jgi:hypothetical protein
MSLVYTKNNAKIFGKNNDTSPSGGGIQQGTASSPNTFELRPDDV